MTNFVSAVLFLYLLSIIKVCQFISSRRRSLDVELYFLFTYPFLASHRTTAIVAIGSLSVGKHHILGFCAKKFLSTPSHLLSRPCAFFKQQRFLSLFNQENLLPIFSPFGFYASHCIRSSPSSPTFSYFSSDLLYPTISPFLISSLLSYVLHASLCSRFCASLAGGSHNHNSVCKPLAFDLGPSLCAVSLLHFFHLPLHRPRFLPAVSNDRHGMAICSLL